MRIATDKERVTSLQEHRLFRLGVPSEFWRIELDAVRFSVSKHKPPKLKSAAAQRSALRKLYQDPARELVVIASDPTEHGALEAAFWLIGGLVNRYHMWLLSADHPWLPKETKRPWRCIMIQNLLAEASVERIERVRDILWHQRQALRIVTVAGTADPEGFALQRLRVNPDVCCFVRDAR